jgi:GT2 family glycosyltransferase
LSIEPHPSRSLRAPVAVRTIDLERLGDLDLFRAGVPYRTALIVALKDGRPIGELSLTVDGVDRISASTLRELADRERWSRTEPPLAVEPIPDVSVVVATCAQPDCLLKTIASVLACDPPALEVIAVENRPARSQVRAALIGRFGADERIRYVEEPRPGLSAARNAGLSAAAGEVVAFTDDDVEVDSGWVGAIARTFAAEPTVGCVTGLILPSDLETSEQVLVEQFAGFGKGFERRVYRLSEPNSPLFPFAAGEFGSGASTAGRADVLRALGGFDAVLGAGTAARGAEDLDLYIRTLLAGHALAYEPAAILWHKHPQGRERFRRRLFDYGVSLSAMLTKYAVLGYGPEIARRVPAAVRHLSQSDSRKNMRKGSGYSPQLDWIERAGMVAGPLAYGMSRWQERRDGYAVTGTPQVTHQPKWVGKWDVMAPAELKPPHTPAGTPYACARLLVCHGEVPLGFVDVTLKQGAAPADAVRAEIARQLPEATAPQAPAPSAPSPPLPSISVVICTRDRPDVLRDALVSVLEVEYENYDLVVVDNAPTTSATKDLVTELADPRIRYVLEPRPGLSRARNRGVAHATGEIIAFTDDDVVVDPAWLQSIVRGFRRSDGVACVTGLVVAAQLDTAAQAYFDAKVKWSANLTTRLFDLHEHRGDDPLFPYRAGNLGAGANFAVLTATAIELGAFDEALGAGSPTRGGEDLDFFARVILAGHTLAYEPSSLVWHSHRSELDAVRDQMFAYRCGLAAYALKHLTTSRAIRLILATAVRGNRQDGATPAIRPLSTPIPGMLRGEMAGLAVAPVAYLTGTVRARRRSR